MNNNDLIILLEKRECPKDNKTFGEEYVCLGHFDYAIIRPVVAQERQKEFYELSSHTKLEEEYKDSKDPEGIQRNYLIAYSPKGFPYYDVDFSDYRFVFMMTITIEPKPDEDFKLEKYADLLYQDLKKAIGSTETKGLVYYPISKGDLIVLLYANSFTVAIRLLSQFVRSENIRYSYTIPMVRATWIKSKGQILTEDNDIDCKMRLRATVISYDALESFIMNDMVQKDGSPFVKEEVVKRTSYGTDDIEYNLGTFSQKRLKWYLNHVIDNQEEFRHNCVFSAEMDITRRID